jgi:hypothetical protein
MQGIPLFGKVWGQISAGIIHIQPIKHDDMTGRKISAYL